MADTPTTPRQRQLARLNGAPSPSVPTAMALAKSQAYQDAADLADFKAWCVQNGLEPMPARTNETPGFDR